MSRPVIAIATAVALMGLVSVVAAETNEATTNAPDEAPNDATNEATDGAAVDAPPATSDDVVEMPPEDASAPAPVETAARTDDVDGELGTSERIESADGMGDQGIGAAMGIAAGGRVTPGGLRISGHYLYQLSNDDWFDGTASFTFGGGDAACFQDRMAVTQCGHDFNDGNAIELAAGVRRMFAARGTFRPFARAAVGLSFVRFRNDDVTGLAIPVHLGGGVRARVAPGLAVVGQAVVMFGFGGFGRGLGAEPQLGMAVTAGAEFQLR
ncbi:MAG TPA: hypothetical protein VIU61_00695 [Kofleriaceae bacterium]